MSIEDDELAALVTAARSGDRAAFDDLVRRTHADTYTLAYRLCRNEEDARDVVQETYLRAYRSIGKFRGDARFSTWLYRITANCAANHLGRRNRDDHDELPETVVDGDPVSDPSAQADAAELRRDLAEAIDELSPKLRAVVVLRDIYELPHDEIAHELGISTTAAKVRLHRARAQLRNRLFGPAERSGDEEVRRAV